MNNNASILMYKSSRKNSKASDSISINYLINKSGIISDGRVLQQFINTIDEVCHYSKLNKKHLELNCSAMIEKNLQFLNANNEQHQTKERIFYNFTRQKFYSFEKCINFIYSIYLMIYPCNKLHLKDIYNNPSVKYIINKYYKSEV